MSNEILFFITLVANFTGIIVFYALFKKTGLYVWIAIATIIANIEVAKCVDIFGMSVTLGNVIYGTVFLATDILSEKHGAKESRKGVWIGFASMLAFVACVQLSLLYTPNSTDFVSASMHTIFDIMPRICVASLVSYLISNLLDTYLYAAIKKVLPSDKWLWVRNNAATWLSQIVDSALFTTLAFAGVFEKGVLLELIFTTYAIKVIVAVFDTPFLYIAKKIKE